MIMEVQGGCRSCGDAVGAERREGYRNCTPPFESSPVMEVFAVRVNTTSLENHTQPPQRDPQQGQTSTEAFQDEGQLPTGTRDSLFP